VAWCGAQKLSEYVMLDIPMLLRESRTQRLMPLPVPVPVPAAARGFVFDRPEVLWRAVSHPVGEEHIRSDQIRSDQNRTEQIRTDQIRSEQNRTEQNRTEQNRTEQNGTELISI
jgi:hypothetical protein